MHYLEFKNKYHNLPIIVTNDIFLDSKNTQTLRNQLNRWQKKGLLQKLRRGIFAFNQSDRKKNLNIYYIANRLYEPSYISLEFALNYYDLIPERVSNITSVSSQKTMKFNNSLGCFTYQHVKPAAFRGFKQIKIDSMLVFMAEPEKAVLDFFYLNLSKFTRNIRNVILTSYRFENFDKLSTKRLLDLSELFKCKKLTKVTKQFCELIDKY